MCLSCWHEHGAPAIVNERTKRAADLVCAIYDHPHAGAGGNAHCVVDDWNLRDSDIESVIREPPFIAESTFEQLQAEMRCMLALKALTLDERYSAMALADGALRGDGMVEEWAKRKGER